MTEPNAFNQVLEELKTLREQQEISLQAIASETRINLNYLLLLEQGELEKIPRVYDRMIFKTYLEWVCPDRLEQYLQMFDELTGRSPRTSTTVRMRRLEMEKRRLTNFTLLKLFYIVVPIVVLVVLVIVFIANYQPDEVSSSQAIEELTAQQIVEKVGHEEAPATVAPQQKHDSLTIGLEAADACWLNYVVDHRDTSDITLYKGNRLRVVADSVVEFSIGNPVALTFVLNGRDVGQLAPAGKVIAYLKATAKGIVQKRVVTPKIKPVRVENDSTQNN